MDIRNVLFRKSSSEELDIRDDHDSKVPNRASTQSAHVNIILVCYVYLKSKVWGGGI